ncbi:hypothetical protein GCM10010038_13790 [Glutamicibacter protophormiae]|nr:hypothetical protein GCM10010038_13790 [Glutamicibacter protophormiae]
MALPTVYFEAASAADVEPITGDTTAIAVASAAVAATAFAKRFLLGRLCERGVSLSIFVKGRPLIIGLSSKHAQGVTGAKYWGRMGEHVVGGNAPYPT